MDKINVMLYGGVDKNKKNRAEVIYCDKCNICSFYKKGTCLNVTAPFNKGCKYGKIDIKYGYTQRAQKRYAFDSLYKNDKLYGNLRNPTDWTIGLIGNIVVFNLRFVVVDKKQYIGGQWENIDHYNVRESGLFSTGSLSYVELDNLDIELLRKIVSFIPRTVIGSDIIFEYIDKIIPNMLFELSLLLPDLYTEFVNCYSKYKEIKPNFIGRYAYIHTLEDNTIITDSTGIFVKKGNKLISDNYSSAFLPFSCKHATIEINITDNMVCKITDNKQVTENTVFK